MKELPILALSHCPDHINKSALWTSVCVCIMDDLAESPEREWMPRTDNEALLR